ncbi:MAG: sel1 repeat family protein [Fibromonadaceae bacterium]|jgi:TPR repeat protein|nr:sel1 repeat family protein [Fibromonadaceae bacterium]
MNDNPTTAEEQYSLGLLYEGGRDGFPKDFEKANHWYAKATEQGHAMAQYSLGMAYANGNGVQKDLAKAEELWTKAAEKGEMWVQYNLGFNYSCGYCVSKNTEKAIYWLTKAAEQGSEKAEKALASIR